MEPRLYVRSLSNEMSFVIDIWHIPGLIDVKVDEYRKRNE